MHSPSRRLTPLVATALTLLAPGLAGQKSQDELKASFAAMQTHDWYTGSTVVGAAASYAELKPKKLAELDAAVAGLEK